jgi:hypothetical protein
MRSGCKEKSIQITHVYGSTPIANIATLAIAKCCQEFTVATSLDNEELRRRRRLAIGMAT